MRPRAVRHKTALTRLFCTTRQAATAGARRVSLSADVLMAAATLAGSGTSSGKSEAAYALDCHVPYRYSRKPCAPRKQRFFGWCCWMSTRSLQGAAWIQSQPVWVMAGGRGGGEHAP